MNWPKPIAECAVGAGSARQFTDSPGVTHLFANAPIPLAVPHNQSMHTARAVALMLVVILTTAVRAQDVQSPAPTITDAYRLFYNAHYEEAAALALSLRAAGTQDLENDEVRTSALLFQLRGLLNGQDASDNDNRSEKGEVLKSCGARCAGVMDAFNADLHHGQAVARERLKTSPDDEEALFFLGKLDLNYVWLELGLLGHKTGWDEVLGSAKITRRGAQTEPESRPRPSRPRLDRLHRQHAHAVGHAVDPRRRQQETRNRRGTRSVDDECGVLTRGLKRSSRCGT